MSDNRVSGDNLLSVEKVGIDRIDESNRHGTPINQFTIRFSPVIYLAPMFIGAISIPHGLGLAGSIAAILIGTMLGSIATGICAAMGPRRGMTQLVMSRLSFGYHGNYLPAFCAALISLGYTTIGIIVGVKALMNMTNLPYVPLTVAISIISIIITVYGYDLLHFIGRWVTALSVIVLLITTTFALVHGTGTAGVSTLTGYKYWIEWLAEFAIAFSFCVSWSFYAADYSRYLPSSANFGRVFGYALSGLFSSTSWMMSLGALLASVAPGGVLAGLDAVLPGVVLVVVLGWLTVTSLPHNAVNLYSFVMQTMACDFPLKRIPLAILAGVIVCIAALFLGRVGFVGNLETFMIVLSYVVVPWFSIVLIDFLLEADTSRQESEAFFNKNGSFRGIRWAAISAFLAGIVISFPFMSNGMFAGPIAQSLGGADISYFVSFVATSAIYAILKLTGASVPASSTDAYAVNED